jgi:hypothetical protein
MRFINEVKRLKNSISEASIIFVLLSSLSMFQIRTINLEEPNLI